MRKGRWGVDAWGVLSKTHIIPTNHGGFYQHISQDIMMPRATGTHHPTLISIEELHHLLRLLLPQEHVAAVTATHNVLTPRAIEVNAFHWKNKQWRSTVHLCLVSVISCRPCHCDRFNGVIPSWGSPASKLQSASLHLLLEISPPGHSSFGFSATVIHYPHHVMPLAVNSLSLKGEHRSLMCTMISVYAVHLKAKGLKNATSLCHAQEWNLVTRFTTQYVSQPATNSCHRSLHQKTSDHE